MATELRDTGTDPHHDDQQFERQDHVDERQECEEEDRRQVLLTTGSDEGHLVPQPENHHEYQEGVQDRRTHQSGIVSDCRIDSCGVNTGKNSGNKEIGDCGGIDEDVEHRAGVTRGERHFARPRWQTNGARAEPVENSTGHRLEVAGERSPGSCQAQHLEHHRPDDEFLVDDRLVPPRSDVEPREAGSQSGNGCSSRQVEEQQFHDVDGVDHLRRTEAVIHPVRGHVTQTLEKRLVHERCRIDGREVSFFESHDVLLKYGMWA